jgi:hypothetical protein
MPDETIEASTMIVSVFPSAFSILSLVFEQA